MQVLVHVAQNAKVENFMPVSLKKAAFTANYSGSVARQYL